MSVYMSKPPKPLKIKSSESTALKPFKWRNSEERRVAKRRIDAIRRQAERDHQALAQGVDGKVLRNPKILMGMLFLLMLVGGALLNFAFRKPAQAAHQRTIQQSHIARTQKSLKVIATAMAMFRVDTKQWPSQRLGLYALAKDYAIEGWKGPYINWAYNDRWGNPFVYEMPLSPFEAPVVFSCGPDGKPHTADDLSTYPEDYVCDKDEWRQLPTADDAVNEETLAPVMTEPLPSPITTDKKL